MNIETRKSGIKVNEAVAGCGSEVLAETDVILTEEYPDILRVLQIDGVTSIKEKEVGNDRVILRGEVEFTVIYVPDPQMSELPAKSITATAVFTDVCEARGVSADMKIRSTADISNIDYNLINSRKIGVKATVATEIKAYREGETEFVCDVVSDEAIETLQKEAQAFRQEADDDFVISVADKLEVPNGKPSCAEILKVSASVGGNDVKLIAGKAIVKGNVKVSTLYIGSDEMEIEFMEHEIPFTEILDLPNVAEGMDCDVDYNVTSVYYETDDGEDGGARMMGVEITLLINANVTGRESAVLLSDCYSPACDISMVKKVCSIDHIAACLKPQITVKGNIELSEDCPGISRVYDIVAKAFISKVELQDGHAVIDGMLETCLLYLTDDEQMPIYSHKSGIPFTHTVDIDGISEASVECRASVINCGYNLADEQNVNVRANVCISLRLIKSEKVDVIEEINVSEAQAPKHASIVVYFVQSGDSLWSIAKKYKTTVAKIAEVNKLDAGQPLQIGIRLLI